MLVASPETFAEAYTDYHHHGGYARRAQLLQHLPDPIVVVGCGFGYLVVELQQLGKLAYGIDVSDYCWDHRVTTAFSQHDILRGPPKLNAATVVTEDLLPWLSDAEAVTAAKNCALLSPLVLHLVTESGQADYNYHSTGYWMKLLDQLTISLEGM